MPYENEHSAQLLNPDLHHIRVQRGKGCTAVQGVKIPENISIIWYIVSSNGTETPQAQALRFPTRTWTEKEAKSWLKDNKIKSIDFEPAANKETNFYDYENKSKNELDIALHRDIGFSEETTSEAFFDLLTPELTHIRLDINSNGGYVRDGISIYNQLKDHPAHVHVKISGFAASIASTIAMSANTIEMPRTAIMLLHPPSLPMVLGANSKELRKQAEALDIMERSIVMAYQEKSGLTETQIRKLMDEVTWLNGDEAVKLGLADEMTDEIVDVMDYHDFSDYQNVPTAAVNLYSIDANVPIQQIETAELNFISKFKKYFNIPKEEDMSNRDRENELTTQLSDSQAENKTLTDKFAVIEAENKTLKSAQESAAKVAVAASNKVFLGDMLKEDIVRIRPKDVEMHLENMANKDESGLEKYKKWLKEFPPVVDVSGQHFANKETAASVSITPKDDEFMKEIHNIIATDKCTHLEALDKLKTLKPELCNN